MKNSPADMPNRAAARGFTLVEMIVVIIIIGILATLIAPRLIGRVGQGKQAVAQQRAAAIASAVKLYQADYSAYPTSINDLAARPSNAGGKGPYVDKAEDLMDPWGKPFILKTDSDKKNFDFDVVSYGADGKPGGAGEDEDVIKP